MDESKWTCDRCGEEYDLEKGEGWVLLVEETPSPDDDKLSSIEPYDAVCYDCADVLHRLTEECNRNCVACEVPRTWGLTVRDCLEFQMKFGLLELEVPQVQGEANFMGCLCDARDVLRQFRTYWRSLGFRWEE
jgi:hypothetical protein